MSMRVCELTNRHRVVVLPPSWSLTCSIDSPKSIVNTHLQPGRREDNLVSISATALSERAQLKVQDIIMNIKVVPEGCAGERSTSSYSSYITSPSPTHSFLLLLSSYPPSTQTHIHVYQPLHTFPLHPPTTTATFSLTTPPTSIYFNHEDHSLCRHPRPGRLPGHGRRPCSRPRMHQIRHRPPHRQ